jgi:polyhydroxybutyrate depolymerase
VKDTVAFWLKEDGCSATRDHKESGVLRTDAYSDCAEGSGVTLQTIDGGHHMWPGLRISGNDIPASNMIWDFFAKHPKS